MKAFRLIVALLLVGAWVCGVVPIDRPSFGGTAPASATRGMGQTPLEDILYWADQKKACGLSRDQLAAMMMAPTYPETGASGTQAPSPMTLSRWDTQAALWAFGDRSTPYQRAFWHPGVGMWQFDSAGGWNLTAATAISTATSAEQAATVMAQRWCTSPSLRYAWGPWYGCATSTICEDIYNELFDGTQLRNVTVYATVTRDGGMETRSCRLFATTVPCHYVDPAKAQGFAGWAVPSAGPTPVTAPFYVVSMDGREYRFWLKDDTGYPVTVSADKPIRANARTSLVWSTAGGLCDLSFGRGDCGAPPRVATTPWGPRVALPIGSLDAATPGAAWISVSGWTIDPDSSDPIDVHVYLDGRWNRAVRADRSRPDVAAAIPGYGDLHGYQTTIGGVSGGPHEVCVFAINVGPYGDHNPLLGCRNVLISGEPFGSLDSAAMGPGGMWIEGWALDPDTTGPVGVHVYVDGRWGGLGVTDRVRTDVEQVYPWWGANRGYRVLASASPGRHTFCAYGINVSSGSTNPLLGCRVFDVPDGTPIGSLDGAARVAGGVRLSGWALDPSTSDPLAIHAYVNNGWGGAYTANVERRDVGAAFPGFGDLHGFDVTIPVGSAPATVCVYAINVGPGRTNPLVGCRVI
jgi:hypothetical protein